jgi:hypothetical protein
MDQFLFQDTPEKDRALKLESLSEGIEKRDYAVWLTPEELTERKSQLTTLVIQEAKLQDKKADMLAEIKAEMKPIVEDKKAVLTEIKSGTIQETGICYKIIDENTKQVGFYNKRGQLVDQRPMTMDDRQMTLKIAVNE